MLLFFQGGRGMGITDKMSQLADNVQQGVKNSSVSLLSMIFKVITCFVFSLTVALAGQVLMQYGTLLFLFMMVVVGGLLFKLIFKWGLGSVLIFDLICVLVALLLRMYILIAP
jgi:hypothetical protein